MEFIGTIAAVRPLQKGTFISLDTDQTVFDECEKLKDKKLKVELKIYREKRSLDANAYAWVLMSKMAEVLRTSKEEVYELMLQRYGTNAIDDDGNLITISVPAKVDIRNADIHCAFMGKGYVGDKEFNHYRVIKGSSMYDTLEMSKFIDGIVSDAQDLEIETATPDEIRMMKERWGV